MGLTQLNRKRAIDDGVEIGNGAGFVFVDGNLLGSIKRIVREELERAERLKAEANASVRKQLEEAAPIVDHPMRSWLWRVWEWGKK